MASLGINAENRARLARPAVNDAFGSSKEPALESIKVPAALNSLKQTKPTEPSSGAPANQPYYKSLPLEPPLGPPPSASDPNSFAVAVPRPVPQIVGRYKKVQISRGGNRRVTDTVVHVKMSDRSYKIKSEEDYRRVAEDIVTILPLAEYDDGSIGPILVRLAWHASGTYDKATGTGGSNGATMRYRQEAHDDANKGLEYARQFLEPIKAKHPWISYADLWTLAGAVAVEAMGGPKIPWKPGRVDYVDEKNVPPNGRLPDGSQGAQHVRDVFYRMGFNDQEIVALSGAHGLGRTHATRSGFHGPWVPSPTRLSNTFFKLLLNEEWHRGKSPAGVEQWYDVDEELMMLPTDMSLVEDPKFREWVKKYADSKDLFFEHFAAVFGKLLELGVRRGPDGLAAVNEVNKVKL